MILYFSATGNTRFVAEELARMLGDDTLDLLDRIRRHDYGTIHSDVPFVICSPVYVGEMPRFLAAYLKKAELVGNRDVYFVFTSGGYAGISGVLAHAIARKKHMRYRGCAEITMPGNHIVSNAFQMRDRSAVMQRIVDARACIPSLARSIQAGERLLSRHVWLLETLATVPFNPAWCHLKQGVREFYVTDACVSCGLCERLCPLGIIRLDEDGMPTWNATRCAHCMSCIQNCPHEAIEYDMRTQHKERYRFDKYRFALEEGEASDDPSTTVL